MASMVAAADLYHHRRVVEEVNNSRSEGYVTCFDPCVMPRKPGTPLPPKIEKTKTIKYPADENGQPLAMEFHEPVLPQSSVPYIRSRFSASTVMDLCETHDGVEEQTGVDGGREHMAKGWTKENDQKFRENEELCRALFGGNWDTRYGRTRVRSAETGGLLCWGDGKTIYDVEGAAAPATLGSVFPESYADTDTEIPDTMPPQRLLRGDTEVRFAPSRVAAELPPGGGLSYRLSDPPAPSVGGAYPFFPPPKMHVTRTVGTLHAAASASNLQRQASQRAGKAQRSAPAPGPTANIGLPPDFAGKLSTRGSAENTADA